MGPPSVAHQPQAGGPEGQGVNTGGVKAPERGHGARPISDRRERPEGRLDRGGVPQRGLDTPEVRPRPRSQAKGMPPPRWAQLPASPYAPPHFPGGIPSAVLFGLPAPNVFTFSPQIAPVHSCPAGAIGSELVSERA